MRAFFNIVIIGLIGLLSSTYLFNLSPIDYKGTIEIETPVNESTLSLEVEEDKILNPESITIRHTATKEEVIKIVSNSIFNVDIYKDNKLVKSNINNLEPVSPSIDATISVNEDNPIITALNITQQNLGLEDGVYKFIFNSTLIADEDKSSASVTVTYDTAGNYYPAVNTAPAGTKGLTLYFPTKNAHTLIPVTRFVVEDKSITRMAIEQLQNGPMNNGLESIIKDVTNTTYNNGNVVIDLPSSYTAYNTGSTGAGLSYESFVKTIFAVDRYWPIYNLTFTVDRKNVDTYFHGKSREDINYLPNVEKNYLLYMAHKADDRYYLFEHPLYPEQIGIAENDTIEMRARKVFDAYSDTDITYGISPVPKTVTLNNASLQGRTLILDFNKEFLNVYKDKNDLRHMMVESFMYTFNTIPGVDSIKITADGEEIHDFIDALDTTQILYPPEFINPETIETQQEE
ncbi:MAG: GerMN domain-containing protein [Tissierellia bacterium]|nr:GerMN domain-containing protein [Tissierellia bacterium]